MTEEERNSKLWGIANDHATAALAQLMNNHLKGGWGTWASFADEPSAIIANEIRAAIEEAIKLVQPDVSPTGS